MKLKPLCVLACALGLVAPLGMAADVDAEAAAAEEAAAQESVTMTVIKCKGGG